LWENHRIESVATPEAWEANPELVLHFYNQRRQQLLEVAPNDAHKYLVDLENQYDVWVITQNVDDLHERAGSSKVVHLHGELRKVRSEKYPELIYNWDHDLNIGDLCERGAQLRPHIVWFGESVPMLETAARIVHDADVFVIIGTSLQVYPAASLMMYSRPEIPYYYIDPKPQINPTLEMMQQLTVIPEKATIGTELLLRNLIS